MPSSPFTLMKPQPTGWNPSILCRWHRARSPHPGTWLCICGVTTSTGGTENAPMYLKIDNTQQWRHLLIRKGTVGWNCSGSRTLVMGITGRTRKKQILRIKVMPFFEAYLEMEIKSNQLLNFPRCCWTNHTWSKLEMTTLSLGTSWFNDQNQSISGSAQAHQDLSCAEIHYRMASSSSRRAGQISELESVFQLDLTTFLLTCGLAEGHRDDISKGRALGALGVWLKPNREILQSTKGRCCRAVAEQGLCFFLSILITSWSCFKSLSL